MSVGFKPSANIDHAADLDTGASLTKRSILDRFAEMVARYAGRLAVVSDAQQWTYGQLDDVGDNLVDRIKPHVMRTMRLLRDRSARFEIIHMPGLTVEDTLDIIGLSSEPSDAQDAEYTARSVHALADGRPAYVRALAEELASMREHGGGDPVSALASLMAIDGRLAKRCCFCYELRLHRARGYGALKAILEILGEEEGLTLTEISQRLLRTPGSTKDYLSWLEDVDLVTAEHKRYSFADPLLRVWVRLHCRATPSDEDDLSREVHRYALPRLPQQEPALVMAAAGGGRSDEDKKPWGIIEID